VIGWADIMPSGLTGAELVRSVAAGRPENHVDTSTPEVQSALLAALRNIDAMTGRLEP
jgi:hypothetical protein